LREDSTPLPPRAKKLSEQATGLHVVDAAIDLVAVVAGRGRKSGAMLDRLSFGSAAP
jgi:hypothetical protein